MLAVNYFIVEQRNFFLPRSSIIRMIYDARAAIFFLFTKNTELFPFLQSINRSSIRNARDRCWKFGVNRVSARAHLSVKQLTESKTAAFVEVLGGHRVFRALPIAPAAMHATRLCKRLCAIENSGFLFLRTLFAGHVSRSLLYPLSYATLCFTRKCV